jgi:HK97 family phage portal protein
MSKKVIKTSVRGLDDSYQPYSGKEGISKTLFTNAKQTDIDTLYNIIKASPEVTGCFQAIIEDIMADEWRFDGSDSAINKVWEFQYKSDFYNILTNAILDLLITGNAYILKLSVDEEKINQVISTLEKNLAKNLGVVSKQQLEIIKQEYKKPKDLQLLKASTIKINYDETGKILSFKQEVKNNERVYLPKDIIHLTTMNIGGEVYGFTALEPLISDIATLILAKEYAGKYFENDGIPNFLFKMPEATVDDRNFQALKQELKELKKKEEKFRSLVVTGNVETTQLQKFDKDMEFRQLIQHFTQVVLIALGVPAHRINWTIDVKQVGGAVNRSYEGYYKKISFMQKIFENKLNSQLWTPFNVEMRFNRSYKIDEMREAQIVQILTQVGAVTLEEAREMMGLEKEIPKGTIPVRTGDQNNINFEQDKRQNDEGRINNPNKPDEEMDNKVKDFSEEVMAIKNIYQNKEKSLELKEADIVKKKEEMEKKQTEIDKAKYEMLAQADKVKYEMLAQADKAKSEMLTQTDKAKSEMLAQAKSEADKVNEQVAIALKNMEEEMNKRLSILQLKNDERAEIMKKDYEAKLKEAIPTSSEVIKIEEFNNLTKKEKKEIIKSVESECIEVNFPHFVRIVEAKVGWMNFDKANILYRETDTEFIMFFSDGMWKYVSRVNKASIDVKAFRVEKLSRAIQIRV